MHAFLRRAAALAAFVALLWAIQIVNWILGYGLNPAFGLVPRHVSGMDGIVAMPLLHGSFAHLIANTPPLLVMGGLYGSFLWGVLPGQPGVSWEAHLFGALAGVAAALLIKSPVHAPRLRGVDRP